MSSKGNHPSEVYVSDLSVKWKQVTGQLEKIESAYSTAETGEDERLSREAMEWDGKAAVLVDDIADHATESTEDALLKLDVASEISRTPILDALKGKPVARLIDSVRDYLRKL